MGLCTADLKKRRPFKTIIIPRGLINPNEHNIIEIPMSLDTTSSLVVKAPSDLNSCFSVEPYRGDLGNPPAVPETPPQMPQMVNSTGTDEKKSPFPDTLSTIRSNPPSEFDNKQRAAKTKVDFSCQAQCPALNPKPSKCMQVPTSSGVYQQNFYQQSKMQPQDAHSPICPICSKASCKYLSNAGMNPPFNSRPNQFSYSSGSGPVNSFGTSYPPTYGDNFRFSFMPGARSEMLSKSKERMENEMLSKMLDEKIDKILKPVLFSLAKFSPEEEESEINLSCITTPRCPPKYNFTSMQPRFSREQAFRKYDLNYEPRMRNTPSYEASTSRRSADADFDEFKRDLKKRDREDLDSSGRSAGSTSTKLSNVVITGGNMMTQIPALGADSDYEESKKRSFSGDRNYNPSCPVNASCQRRTNVSFSEDSGKNEDSKFNDKNISLNSSFISTSTDSMPPRASFF